MLLAVLAYCGYRVVWGKPFTINMLANRQALEFLIANPELFTAIGITDGSILDHHSDKLTPYTVRQRDQGYAQFERFVREVHWFDRAHLAQVKRGQGYSCLLLGSGTIEHAGEYSAEAVWSDQVSPPSAAEPAWPPSAAGTPAS